MLNLCCCHSVHINVGVCVLKGRLTRRVSDFLMCVCLWLASHWPNYTRNKPPLLPCFPPKIPHPSHLQVPAVEPPNTPTWPPPPPLRSSQPERPSHSSPTPQRASTTSTGPSAPICLLNSPPNSTPLFTPPTHPPHLTSLLHSSPSALPRPR